MKKIKKIILLIAATVSLCACRSVNELHTESNTNLRTESQDKRDSIYVERADTVTIYINGDTVRIKEKSIQYVYRDRENNSSIKDSTDNKVNVYVEKQLSRWQKFLIGSGWVFIGLLLLVALYVITIRPIVKRCKKPLL